MENQQPVNPNLEEFRNESLFKEGIEYLIKGGNQCFEEMQLCPVGSMEGQKQVFTLAQRLRMKIDLLCSLYLNSLNRGSADQLSRLARHQDSSKGVEGQIRRLESEVGLEKRRCQKFRKANLKLKRTMN